ncbi:uncharacterized protein LOC118762878 [Octopus sinensis]|uniref:Uncharacterized protein LOC118762878 n=1 Tax=Octopus sinensis TaxID=2607531 RepID=A0A7E6EQR9_9MOLL|nr:uncharacterized protein LOC118762878 [Octopus sinensis]
MHVWDRAVAADTTKAPDASSWLRGIRTKLRQASAMAAISLYLLGLLYIMLNLPENHIKGAHVHGVPVIYIAIHSELIKQYRVSRSQILDRELSTEMADNTKAMNNIASLKVASKQLTTL